jgi:hypothetical protein
MTLQKWLGVVGAVVVLAGIVAWLLTSSQERRLVQAESGVSGAEKPGGPAAGLEAGTDLSARRTPAQPAPPAGKSGGAARRNLTGVEKVDAGRAAGDKYVRIRIGDTLATVNGRSITLKDLLPVDPREADYQLARDEYEAHLQAAITRELIFQAARAQGVELSAAQQHEMETRRAAELAEIERRKRDNNLLWSSVTPAQLDFQARVASATMLQQALLEKMGVARPAPTEDQVKAYYNNNSTQYPALPTDPAEREKVWKTIDIQIRYQLSAELQTAYQQRSNEILNQLRSQAGIQVIPPGS